MDNQPLVSILIPCYNHIDFLDDCLRGVLEQNYKNIELLICDDCSIDGSFKKIKEYQEQLKKRFCRVILRRNEINRGVTSTLNSLLKLAEGKFIKIIASDDVLVESAISIMVHSFAENINTDIVVSNGVEIMENQHYPFYTVGKKIYENPPELSGNDLFEKVFKHNIIFAPGVMIKKSVYEKYGCYDETIAIEDLEFWLRILKERESAFSFIDEILIYYRVSKSSMTALYSNDGLEKRRLRFHLAEMQILDKYGEYVGERIYAEAKLHRVLDEKRIAVNCCLPELNRIVNKECFDLTLWRNLSLKELGYSIYRLIKLYIKQLTIKLYRKG